ncbi:phosphohydrolase [Meiothermus sp. QL-1]|uniref:metallophosphoesterase n=1 Tax=Meiothermus sp. QL-1 TaxID=2058095 RepID=UPI000E0C67DB|nr:metallophosphoesterase [Meiothermus sp. QL-1]RDI96592.1 phosphohydrolase [Meiothermus sp. QL-1]
MRVFAIADIHLSKAQPKPMNIFGPEWAGHPEAVFEEWRRVVGEDDLVIVAGDISWAMKLPEAMADLEDLARLPGRKVLLRGNHDYWWPSISRLRQALPPRMHALQNDALVIGNLAVAGSRGWDTPGSYHFTPEDEKIYKREVERLQLSLKSLKNQHYDHLVLAMHYPPFGPTGGPTGFTELIERYRPTCVVYGHLHGADPTRLPPSWDGIPLHFVAADALRFRPKLVLETAHNPQG